MISKVQESGIMDTIVKMASIMGAMVIGAMTMEMVTVDIPLMVGARWCLARRWPSCSTESSRALSRWGCLESSISWLKKRR